MKCKVTSREIRANYGDRIVKLGYCEAQTLLRDVAPFAYNAGVYGWNYDAYDIGGLCIVTGYRPIGRSVSYNLVNNFEERASAMLDKDYRADLSALRSSFIAVVKKELNI